MYVFSNLLLVLMYLYDRYQLHKLAKFYLISWGRNFVEIHILSVFNTVFISILSLSLSIVFINVSWYIYIYIYIYIYNIYVYIYMYIYILFIYVHIYIYLYLKFHQYVIVCQLQKVLDLQRPPTTEIPWLLQNMSRKSS